MARVIRFGPDPATKREKAWRKLMTFEAKYRYLRKHAPAKAKLVDRTLDNFLEQVLAPHHKGRA
jgi:hypothetical protein